MQALVLAGPGGLILGLSGSLLRCQQWRWWARWVGGWVHNPTNSMCGMNNGSSTDVAILRLPGGSC